MLNKRIISFVVLIVIISLFFIIPTTLSAKEYKTERFNEYSMLRIKYRGDSAKVSILHPLDSKYEVEDYIDKSKNNFYNLLNNPDENMDFIATITLTKPLEIKEFNDLKEKYNLDIQSFKIRALQNDGMRVTIGGMPSQEELVPTNELNLFIGENTFQGVIAFDCRVMLKDIENIKNLDKNFNVLLVNVDSHFIKKEIETKYRKEVVNHVKANDIYWYVENYNLVK